MKKMNPTGELYKLRFIYKFLCCLMVVLVVPSSLTFGQDEIGWTEANCYYESSGSVLYSLGGGSDCTIEDLEHLDENPVYIHVNGIFIQSEDSPPLGYNGYGSEITGYTGLEYAEAAVAHMNQMMEQNQLPNICDGYMFYHPESVYYPNYEGLVDPADYTGQYNLDSPLPEAPPTGIRFVLDGVDYYQNTYLYSLENLNTAAGVLLGDDSFDIENSIEMFFLPNGGWGTGASVGSEVDDFMQGAFIFGSPIGIAPNWVARTALHEIAHSLGLDHSWAYEFTCTGSDVECEEEPFYLDDENVCNETGQNSATPIDRDLTGEDDGLTDTPRNNNCGGGLWLTVDDISPGTADWKWPHCDEPEEITNNLMDYGFTGGSQALTLQQICRMHQVINSNYSDYIANNEVNCTDSELIEDFNDCTLLDYMENPYSTKDWVIGGSSNNFGGNFDESCMAYMDFSMSDVGFMNADEAAYSINMGLFPGVWNSNSLSTDIDQLLITFDYLWHSEHEVSSAHFFAEVTVSGIIEPVIVPIQGLVVSDNSAWADTDEDEAIIDLTEFIGQDISIVIMYIPRPGEFIAVDNFSWCSLEQPCLPPTNVTVCYADKGLQVTWDGMEPGQLGLVQITDVESGLVTDYGPFYPNTNFIKHLIEGNEYLVSVSTECNVLGIGFLNESEPVSLGIITYEPEAAEGLVDDLIDGTITLCPGLVGVDVRVSDYDVYQWSSGQKVQAINIGEFGTHWVEVIDENGCIIREEFEVIEMQLTLPEIIGEEYICPGETIVLDSGVDYPVTWEWFIEDELVGTHIGTTVETGINAAYYMGTITPEGCHVYTGPHVTHIYQNPEPDFFPDNFDALCPGETMQLGAGGGFNEYLWSTGETTQTITVESGTYSVTVSANNSPGCYNEGTIEIPAVEEELEIPIIQANFEPCLTTLSLQDGFGSQKWFFHGKPFSKSAEVVINEPGVYSVDTYNEECGTIQTAIINITNADLAALDFTGTYTVGSTLQLGAVTTEGEIWDQENLRINGVVIVPGGQTLEINDIMVEFIGVNSAIEVLPGGRLIVNNSVLTGDDCVGTYWDGIDVYGNGFGHDYDGNPASDAPIGRAEIYGSTILRAEVGIANGPTPNGLDDPLVGGLIIVDALDGLGEPQRSQFIDCGMGVALYPHDIDFCEITKTDFLFNSVYTHTFELFQKQIGIGCFPNLYKNGFDDNMFEFNSSIASFVPLEERGAGMLTIDCKINVGTTTPNEFRNLFHGIFSFSLPSIYTIARFHNNVFDNVYKGISATGGTFAEYANNSFLNMPPSINNEPTYGLYTHGCTGPIIEGNDFERIVGGSKPGNFGLIVFGAGKYVGSIVENTFRGAYLVATYFGGNNSFLTVDCNDYNFSGNDIYADWYIAPDAFLNDQGSCELLSVEDPRDNIFHNETIGNYHVLNAMTEPVGYKCLAGNAPTLIYNVNVVSDLCSGFPQCFTWIDEDLGEPETIKSLIPSIFDPFTKIKAYTKLLHSRNSIDDFDGIRVDLVDEERVASLKLLIAQYYQEGNNGMVMNLLAQVPLSNKDNLDFYEMYVNLLNGIYPPIGFGKQMDEQESLIREIASSNDSEGQSIANTIRAIYYSELEIPNFKFDFDLGNQELKANDLVAYPNPINSSQKLKLKGIELSEVKSISIYNMFGQLVFESSSVISNLDISEFNKGQYCIEVMDFKNTIKSTSFIVQ